MSWDIYGEPLRRGHCEVHPHVHEEYPCTVCIADKRSSEQQGMCKGGCESEHYLGQAQERIKELEEERDALAEKARTLIGEWRNGQFGDTAAQAESWRESAAQHARNEDFYRGIVRQIGELLGEEARTSDDGSVHDDVLALKVPELVEALEAHVERSAKALNYCNDYLNDNALNSIGHGSKAHCEIRDALEDNPAAKPKEVRYD